MPKYKFPNIKNIDTATLKFYICCTESDLQAREILSPNSDPKQTNALETIFASFMANSCTPMSPDELAAEQEVIKELKEWIQNAKQELNKRPDKDTAQLEIEYAKPKKSKKGNK